MQQKITTQSCLEQEIKIQEINANTRDSTQLTNKDYNTENITSLTEQIDQIQEQNKNTIIMNYLNQTKEYIEIATKNKQNPSTKYLQKANNTLKKTLETTKPYKIQEYDEQTQRLFSLIKKFHQETLLSLSEQIEDAKYEELQELTKDTEYFIQEYSNLINKEQKLIKHTKLLNTYKKQRKPTELIILPKIVFKTYLN